MNAKELRIGNYVEYHVDDFYNTNEPEIGGWIETTIDPEDILFLSSAEDEDYRPIPITPEWLERFGFEKRGIRYNKNGLLLWEDNGMLVFALFESDSNTARNTILRYVHQLQNLYFALTGEELI